MSGPITEALQRGRELAESVATAGEVTVVPDRSAATTSEPAMNLKVLNGITLEEMTRAIRDGVKIHWR